MKASRKVKAQSTKEKHCDISPVLSRASSQSQHRARGGLALQGTV